MKISSIFAIVKNSLYAVKYVSNNTNEFEKVFDNWTDVEYLFNFFTEHKKDLQNGFYGNITVEQAVEKTIEEAEILEEELLEIAEQGKIDNFENLQTLFKPLDNNVYQLQPHLKSKAYGSNYKSWLRIYAIRIAKNTFVISGGAIKLTPTMNEREYLKKELQKLETTKQYLIEQGLFNEDDF